VAGWPLKTSGNDNPSIVSIFEMASSYHATLASLFGSRASSKFAVKLPSHQSIVNSTEAAQATVDVPVVFLLTYPYLSVTTESEKVL
jgi:hypothetical protein